MQPMNIEDVRQKLAQYKDHMWITPGMIESAADELELLRKRVGELEGALGAIRDATRPTAHGSMAQIGGIADRALGGV